MSPDAGPDALFGRVASILEQARGNVVRAGNTQMVLAYCLIYSRRVEISSPLGREFSATDLPPPGFSPQLSWSHDRALMRVDNVAARDFYERERLLIESALEDRRGE